MKDAAPKGHGCPFHPSAQTAKNVGVVIQCEECSKWRCLHSKRKLHTKARRELEVLLETTLYSCGANLSTMDMGDGDPLGDVYARINLTCNTLIELTYYSAGYENICIQCGSTEELHLLDEYYPQCADCNGQKKVQKRGKRFVK
jgi:hypothetical protein